MQRPLRRYDSPRFPYNKHSIECRIYNAIDNRTSGKMFVNILSGAKWSCNGTLCI